MDLDESLEVLAGALASAGMAVWQAPESLEPLERLQERIAPLRLPAELVGFWQRVDVRTLRFTQYPAFRGPAESLQSHEMVKGEFMGMIPLALVQVGYQSHGCLSVEADVDNVPGGALFDWFISDTSSGFRRVADSLGAWLACVAQAIEMGRFTRRDFGNGPYLDIADLVREDIPGIELPVSPTHPVHGDRVRVGGDILQWPAHWQRANGLRPQDLELRGTSHTIAELLDSDPAGQVRATVAGIVVALSGSQGWARARVDDGTAQLDIACPPETTLLGPSIRSSYEFDVVLAAGERHLPQDPEAAATAAGPDPVDRLAATLYARHGGPAGAVATALRRIPSPDED